MLGLKIYRYGMAHGKKAWFMNHVKDYHVRQAQIQGFRSRASYKLLEIDEKFSMIADASTILDLGCAPGSWCQAIKTINSTAKVVAVDLLAMKEVQGVDFYKADARSIALHRLLSDRYGKFDVIVSDMAPNFSGTLFETHEEAIQLNKCCLELSLSQGSEKSTLIMKTVQGNFQKSLALTLKLFYSDVARFKPKSSRTQSAEHYLICRQKRKVENLDRVMVNLQSLRIQEIRSKKDLECLQVDQKD